MAPLPDLDSISRMHTGSVQRHIVERINAAGGALSFADYLQLALYAPGLGYYTAGSTKFGAEGDFVTAPELSPLFGYCIARQAAPLISSTGGCFLEVGAGSGALAVSVLERLRSLDALPREYLILEASPDLAERQARRLADVCPDLIGRVRWLDGLPDDFEGVVVANEVLDAIPFERFAIRDGDVMQQVVGADDGDLVIRERPAGERLVSRVRAVEAEVGRLPEGYVSEVFPAASRWTLDLIASLRRGVVMLLDYGLERRAYYHPDRDDGFLRCHFRHHAHSDALFAPGVQDITSWVDFTAIAEAAAEAGADIVSWQSQAHFLIAAGLEQEVAAMTSGDARAQAESAAAVRTLTLPGEMGENVKVLNCAVGDVEIPASFKLMDRTHLL